MHSQTVNAKTLRRHHPQLKEVIPPAGRNALQAQSPSIPRLRRCLELDHRAIVKAELNGGAMEGLIGSQVDQGFDILIRTNRRRRRR